MRSRIVLLIAAVIASFTCKGQISFTDTIRRYDVERMVIDIKGTNVLGGWALASAVTGGIGYSTAKNDEWKYFHELNIAAGAINGGIALYGLLRTRSQLAQPFDMRRAWHNYQADKKILYVSIGADLACMLTGAYLIDRANNNTRNSAMNRGFGTSLVLQGAFLTVLDNVLLISHNKNSGRWARILDELRISGNGFTYVHTF